MSPACWADAGAEYATAEESTPTGANGGNLARVLRLIEKWQAEPGDYDEQVAAVLGDTIDERREELPRIKLEDWQDRAE